MRAIRIERHGEPDVLQRVDVDVPEPGPGEVRIQVYAVSVNHLDLWTRKGIPGVTLPLPIIPGADVAGRIDAVGAGVHHLKPGDPVSAYPAVSCGHCKACIRGLENCCPQYHVLGHRRDGGCAEAIVVPAVNILRKPVRWTFEETAAAPLVFLTAWHMAVTLAGVQPYDRVLVLSAGSGVGSAAIQICHRIGAHVLTTAGTDPKRKKALELGAEAAFDHYRDDWSQQVLNFTGRQGVDVILDHVGQAVWDHVTRCLGWSGRFVTCGSTSGPSVPLNLQRLFGKQWKMFGAYMGTRSEMLDVWELLDRGDLHPVVDRVFDLEDAAEAHRYLEERRHFGKVVLRVRS